MNKNYTDIESLTASLSQSGPTYSHERLQADIQSLSSTGQALREESTVEKLKMGTLSKDELATILWALDYRMESILHENGIDEEDIVVQKKLYEQLHIIYIKIYDMWKRNDSEK